MVHLYIVGRQGKMGQSLELCNQHFTLTEHIDEADIIIDFSSPQALYEYLPQAKVPIVVGTTGIDLGWLKDHATHLPIFYAENFSLGITLFHRFIASHAEILKTFFSLSFFEIHHKHKKDQPSGTALRSMQALGLEDCHVTRAGEVCGIHTLQCVSAYEVLELRHTALDRKVFAEGALAVAQWMLDKEPGFYTMDHFFETFQAC